MCVGYMVWNVLWLWCLGGGSGIQLKSNGPLSWASAKSFRLRRYWKRRFRVLVACRSSQLHILIGDFLYVLIRTTIKWFLKFCIDCSAAFLWYKCGGGIWNSTDSSLINIFRPSGASLSNLCRIGQRPHCTMYVWTVLHARSISLSDIFFIGSVSIPLLFYS